MKIEPLPIEGAFEITPELRGDPRGLFAEWYRFDRLQEAVGHPLRLAQANLSTSARGVVRGIHFAQVPPGQAKYITCVRGALVDYIVDVRVGSPTFGRWEAVHLDDVDRKAVYIAEGLGHGFCSLADDTTVAYLCSEVYNPAREHAVHPLDPVLNISWPEQSPVLSARDAAAPSLAQAVEQGLLPTYEEYRRHVASLAGPVSPM
jgi:dTDP-4-dehydrorhamnose 3,5-epimerase